MGRELHRTRLRLEQLKQISGSKLRRRVRSRERRQRHRVEPQQCEALQGQREHRKSENGAQKREFEPKRGHRQIAG